MEKVKAFFAKLSKRERLIFYLTSLVLFLGMMDRLVYQPVVSLLTKLDQEILAQEIQLQKNLKNLALRDAIQLKYAGYAAFTVSSGPDEEEIGSLLNEVEGVARSAGLSLVNMKPKPMAKTSLEKLYPVEVEVEADMASLIKFIHGLHKSKYILGVKKMNLAPKDKKGERIKGYVLIQKTVIN